MCLSWVLALTNEVDPIEILENEFLNMNESNESVEGISTGLDRLFDKVGSIHGHTNHAMSADH